jgi:hypothetical protein
MSSRNTIVTAKTVLNRILEDTAFIFTDALEEGEVPAASLWNPTGVGLHFTGPTAGEVRMWVDPGFAMLAAANMLGIEPGTVGAAERGIDALKEILNIMLGNLITDIFGTDPVFDLGLPQLIEPEKLADDLESDNAFWLQADGSPLLCVVEVASSE